MVSLLKLAMCTLVDLLGWVLLCVLPLFTTVMSRQDSTAQEVTTFSRGLSLPGESLLLPSFQGKNTKGGRLTPTQALLLTYIIYRSLPIWLQAKTAANAAVCASESCSSRGESCAEPADGPPPCDVITARLPKRRRGGGGGEDLRPGSVCRSTHMWTGFLTPATGTCLCVVVQPAGQASA